MNRTLALLLSALYDGALAPEHRADLEKSGLSDETIRRQGIRSIPPDLIDRLLGFPTPKVTSAYLIPFPDPRGGWMNHIRMKVFPSLVNSQGHTTKYLGPKGAPPHLYFTASCGTVALANAAPVWFIEGAKKALAVSQLGLSAVGFEGIEGWHRRGTVELLPDFDAMVLEDRVIELVPDGDWRTNPHVARGVHRFADALRARGARPRLVVLPEPLPVVA